MTTQSDSDPRGMRVALPCPDCGLTLHYYGDAASFSRIYRHATVYCAWIRQN